MTLRIVLCFLLDLNFTIIHAQHVNGYAEVTSITGNVLSLANVNETGDSFENGEQIIIMQMQDDVIGENISNTSSFGNLSSIESVGLYEIHTISTHTESSEVPIFITLSSSLINTFNTGEHSKVQIITFPKLGAPHYQTTADIVALDWDGNIGGVLAFDVDSTLTLTHNLSAEAKGFRGGSASLNFFSGGNSCDASQYIRTSNHQRAGEKGEGIYLPTTIDHMYSRGRLLNGGGGGSERINGGGGGGGNFTAGGLAGPGWPNCTPSTGGLGGADLSGHISPSRVFMGGGGGGGQQNNSNSTNGGNGGGIIIIRAHTILSDCGSSVSINADGEDAADGGNDGIGGGGAGGSIVFQVANWSISESCPLTISASGGNGGNALTSGTHAGGGGGGQGFISYSSDQPTTNLSTNTTVGIGGLSCSSCDRANDGEGVNDIGIVDNSSGPLPIDLVSFTVRPENNRTVLINWETSTEINNDYFTVERSKDGVIWKELGRMDGAGNVSSRETYSMRDFSPLFGISYYRLKQTDFNGSIRFFNRKRVILSFNADAQVNLYPNPTEGYLTIVAPENELEVLRLYNTLGLEVQVKVQEVRSMNQQMELMLNLSSIRAGIYFLKTKNSFFKIKKQ